MASLAALLAGRGWRVEGTDRDEVAAAKVLASLGSAAAEPDNRGPDLVVHSAAVRDRDPHLVAARRSGIPIYSLPDALAAITHEPGVSPVVVAGTHGKSTTTALLGAMLAAGGRDPSVWFGATEVTAAGPKAGGTAGGGREFVLEGCEYRRHFLRYRADAAVVTSVEADHFDCYENGDAVVTAFTDFICGVAADGPVVINGDDRGATTAAELAGRDAVTFSVGSSGGPDERDSSTHGTAAWHAVDTDRRGDRLGLVLSHRGNAVGRLTSRLPGRHNAVNVVAAAVTALELGVPFSAVSRATAGFRGLRRRFEQYGIQHGRVLIDDYAHHPTAVATTIETAKQCRPGRRVVVVFEPHQASRLAALRSEHAEALATADAVVLTDVFGAREDGIDAGGEADRLAGSLRDRGLMVTRTGPAGAAVDRVVAAIDDAARPGDVLITMGAGHIEQVRDALSRQLRPDHPD